MGSFKPTPEQRESLIERCDGLFIFASIACRLLEDACSENQPLGEILQEFTSLDALYHQALLRADRSPKYTRNALRTIMGIIIVAQEPLSISAIIELFPKSVPSTDVPKLIGRLGSILASGGLDEPVYILHATLTEFLLRHTWVTKGNEMAKNEYALSRPQCNRLMAQSCLSILLKGLRSNNCAVSPDLLKSRAAEDPMQDPIRRSTTSAFRYAISTWTSHTIPTLHNQEVRDIVRVFFQQKLLNWIEVGAISKCLSDYMLNIRHLQLGMKEMLKLLSVSVVGLHFPRFSG
jgi:hypothetical protein